MKNWKKLWFAEIDKMTPELDTSVLREPIPDGAKKSVKSRPFLYAVPAAVAMCVMLIFTVSYLLIPKGDGQFVTSAVTVEVNPKAVFVTDSDGIVTEVISMNADADVILSSVERTGVMLGKPLSEAVVRFLDYSARAGYMHLDSPDAIRISAAADAKDEWLREAASALRDYFVENSISAVVVSEKIDIESFCMRSGIPTLGGKDELRGYFEESAELFCQRQMQGKSDAEIEQSYREAFLDGFIKNELTAKIDSLVADTMELNALNISIIAGTGMDYFTAREFSSYNPLLGEDDEALINSMEEKLLEYELNYGVKIESTEQLTERTLDIADMLTEFLSVWSESVADALGFVQTNISLDEGLLSLVSTLPHTADEYAVSAKAASARLYDNITADFLSEFESDRVAIGYAELEVQIIAEYGSLSAFFEFVSENG